MKFILCLFALLSVASAYKSYINVAGRNVIGEGRGALSSATLNSLRAGGKGLSGSLSAVSPVKKFAQIARVQPKAYSVPQVIAPPPAPVVQVAAVQPEYVAQVIEQVPETAAVAAPQFVSTPQLSYSTAPQVSSLSALSSQSLLPISQAYDVAPQGGVITAAVQTRYRIQYVDVPSTGGPGPSPQIVIPASAQPLEISFQSQSSPVNVRQVHIPGQVSQPQFSTHQEQPDILKQEIVKPIIQEITEAIQPIRKIVQEVRPVQESINQILTRGEVRAVTAQPAIAQIAAPAISQQAIASPVLARPITIQAIQPQLTQIASPVLARPVQTIATPVFSKPISVNLVTKPTLNLVKPSSAALAGLSRPSFSFGGTVIGNQIGDTQQIEQSLIDKKKKAAK